MPGMAIGRLEPRPAFAEVDLAGDAGADHPLERAVDGRAADPGILLPDQIEQIVGAEMPLLPQEDVRMRSRLLERLPPAGRRLAISGSGRFQGYR